MSSVQIGALRYDILSDTTSFQKGMKITRSEMRQSTKIFKDTRSPLNQLKDAEARLNNLREKGIISIRGYIMQMAKLHRKKDQATADAKREDRALQKLKLQYKIMPKFIRDRINWHHRYGKTLDAIYRKETRNRRAGVGGSGSQRLANFGGSMGSALGFGGAGAGLGRMMGYGAVLGSIGAGSVLVKKAIDEFRELETAIVDMQVIMGDDKAGLALVDNLKEIARTTPLTSKALIKGTQTILGYGLAAEGVEDTMYRIGEIAGGDTARMDSLTRAFAQVQSAGKLMGQEMLQLVNAGFPIKAIADAAGVSMKDFRKEMEAGNISAKYLTQAMINLTQEGGMMEGRLKRQAETINGAWTIATGSIEQALANFGGSTKTEIRDFIGLFGEASVATINYAGQVARFWNEVVTGVSDAEYHLDEWGNKMTWWESQAEHFEDSILTKWFGITQEEIDAQRSRDNRAKRWDQAAKSRIRKEKAEADAKKKLIQSELDERDRLIASENEKTKAIKKSMEGEVTLAKIKARHAQEQLEVEKKLDEMREHLSQEEFKKYEQSVHERQKAEIEAFHWSKREERIDALVDKEKERFREEMANIKKAFDLRKAEIDKASARERAAAAAAGKSGGYSGDYNAGGASYAFLQQIGTEAEQNAIVNESDKKRNQALEDLKRQNVQKERNAQLRHDNLILTIQTKDSAI